ATVVGVMPPEMAFPEGAALWWREADGVPGGLPVETRDAWYFGVVARLAPGASLDDARGDMRRLTDALAGAHPETNRGTGVRLVPLLEDQVGAVRATLLLILGAAGLVLLIACVNVANLLLVRAAGRGADWVRAALGARRRHLLARSLAEAGLLAALGGAAGAALAWLAVPMLGGALATGLPRAGELAVDGRILAFGAAATGLALLLAAAGPALLASRPSGAAGRVVPGGGPSAGRLRAGLVSVEVALALALVAAAALVLRSGLALGAVDPGFEPEGLLAVGVALPAAGDDARAERILAWSRIREGVAALPGVGAAAVAQAGPTEDGWRAGLKVEGRPVAPDQEMDVAWQVVGDGYFATAGVRLLQGRAFQPGDREGSEPVGVASAALARAVWPGEDAVGRRLRVGLDGPGWVRVVGVVEDTRNRGPTVAPLPALYRPLAQRSAWPADEALLLVRHRGAPGVAAAVRQTVGSIRPDAPVLSVRTGVGLLGEHTERTRLVLRLLAAFAALALLLGAVGIYGVTASLVAERTRELAVRRALGAGRGAVAALVLRGGLGVVAVGLVAGAGAAIVAGRLLRGLLFGVGPADPVALAGAAAVLTVAALLAMAGPVRRATSVEPATVLRD
ncbi:MAG: ABC transporter permease, partial [Gemmatimonadetes bacterium]|nr:ABC transporter permease [Gemmatimonadota bacterium]